MIASLSKRKRTASVLGLAFDGSRLRGVVVRRKNGSCAMGQPFAFELALNPLASDPELTGREIRNGLDKAEVRERRCVVCLPVNWAVTLNVAIPELPEGDIPGFLQIEAERSLPYGQDAAMIAHSRFRLPDRAEYALVVAIPRERLELLEGALTAAELRPASFTLGTTALAAADSHQAPGLLALYVGESRVDLQITCCGG